MMQNVRRVQGNGTIKRPDEQQYTNTTILPRERTVNSISYYARRKKELKRNPSSNDVVISLANRHAERTDLKDHIQSIFMSTKSIDPFISNYIKEIRVDPVIIDNKFTSFNQEQYPLNEDEKVKVLEERYFPLQNYYNYIYDLELKKELSRYVGDNEEKVVGLVGRERFSDRKMNIEEVESVKEGNSLDFQDILDQKPTVKDKKIKGHYEGRFEPKLRINRDNGLGIRQFVLQQKPIGNESSFKFSVNENDRMLLSKQPQFRLQ